MNIDQLLRTYTQPPCSFAEVDLPSNVSPVGSRMFIAPSGEATLTIWPDTKRVQLAACFAPDQDAQTAIDHANFLAILPATLGDPDRVAWVQALLKERRSLTYLRNTKHYTYTLNIGDIKNMITLLVEEK